MGEENVILSDGVLYIDGKEFGQTIIEPFTCDIHHTCEEHRGEIFSFKEMITSESEISFKISFNVELFYKLTGLWDYVYNNCPNRRVVHLMNYGGTKRTRMKNFKRGLRIIGRIL